MPGFRCHRKPLIPGTSIQGSPQGVPTRPLRPGSLTVPGVQVGHAPRLGSWWEPAEPEDTTPDPLPRRGGRRRHQEEVRHDAGEGRADRVHPPGLQHHGRVRPDRVRPEDVRELAGEGPGLQGRGRHGDGDPQGRRRDPRREPRRGPQDGVRGLEREVPGSPGVPAPAAVDRRPGGTRPLQPPPGADVRAEQADPARGEHLPERRQDDDADDALRRVPDLHQPGDQDRADLEDRGHGQGHGLGCQVSSDPPGPHRPDQRLRPRGWLRGDRRRVVLRPRPAGRLRAGPQGQGPDAAGPGPRLAGLREAPRPDPGRRRRRQRERPGVAQAAPVADPGGRQPAGHVGAHRSDRDPDRPRRPVLPAPERRELPER